MRPRLSIATARVISKSIGEIKIPPKIVQNKSKTLLKIRFDLCAKLFFTFNIKIFSLNRMETFALDMGVPIKSGMNEIFFTRGDIS